MKNSETYNTSLINEFMTRILSILKYIGIGLLATLVLATPINASVATREAGMSGEIVVDIYSGADIRIEKLERYLKKYNSPCASYASVFVAAADRYNLDYRLVPAISGAESTFCRFIPYQSYNAWGWANGEYRFKSWEEAIYTINKGLRENYINKGLVTIEQIAPVYAPPSKTWAGNVMFFMSEMLENEYDDLLALKLTL